jgi:uncharacterized SAM-binding protein YcdF (DUF218 family)
MQAAVSTRLLRILGGGVLVLFVVVAFTPAIPALRYWTVPSRPPEHAEAIVVLGAGGVTPDGTLTDTSLRGAIDAITLYEQGIAPLVVFSGSPEDGRTAEADARAHLARRCGIPSSAILTTSTAHTTHEEALEIRTLLTSRGIRKVMLLARAPGMARAMVVFERAGFEVVPAPWDDVLDFSAGPEERIELARQVLKELIAHLYYRAAGYL